MKLKKGEDIRKILENKKSRLEEQRKVEENTKKKLQRQKLIQKVYQIISVIYTERAIEINDTVQNIKFTQSRSHAQTDMEALSKLDKSKLSKIRIELNKIEDIYFTE